MKLEAPYYIYERSGSKEPFSVWMAEKWCEYLKLRGIVRPTPRVVHGVVDMTESEWLNYVKDVHRTDMNRWLVSSCAPPQDAYSKDVEMTTTPKTPVAPKVGDILYSSWGYEQTNIDFYQVIAVTKASVRIRKINGKRVEGNALVADPGVWASPGSRTVDQDPEYFEKGILKRVRTDRDGYSVSLTSYSSAWLWDGKPKYDTYAYGGLGH